MYSGISTRQPLRQFIGQRQYLTSPAFLTKSVVSDLQSLTSRKRVKCFRPVRVHTPNELIVEEEQQSTNGNNGNIAKLEENIRVQDVITSIDACTNLSQAWNYMSYIHNDLRAITDPHHKPVTSLTYKQLNEQIEICARGLQQLGVGKGDVISLFSENSLRWLLLDAAIMRNGGIDAVRGVSSSTEELTYIYEHSGSIGLVVQDEATLEKIVNNLSDKVVKFVIVMWGDIPEEMRSKISCPIYQFEQFFEMGQFAMTQNGSQVWPDVQESDPATIVYTSGTSGKPKGVLLSHGNILYQLRNFDYFLPLQQGDKGLSLLPPWHIYERTTTYYILSRGCDVTYTNVPNLKVDLTKYQPNYMCVVPLVMDTLNKRVMQKLRQKFPALVVNAIFGVGEWYVKSRRIIQGMDLKYALEQPSFQTQFLARLKALCLGWLYAIMDKVVYSKIRTELGIQSALVSGGSSLPEHLDLFYQVIGLKVLHGWGLTETSPVLSCRPLSKGGDPAGTIGLVTPNTQIKIVDETTFEEKQQGETGLMLAKGPGVMLGYYNQEDKGVSPDGWFNTGDLGWIIPKRDHHNMEGTVVITGRAKDVIVLSSGENVSPQPIEDQLTSSPYIRQCVLLGQDHRQLGAFVCMDEEIVSEQFPEGCDERALVQQEILRLINKNQKFARWEHIASFTILPKQLSFEDGTLTRTMKPKREAILKKFEKEANDLLAKLR